MLLRATLRAAAVALVLLAACDSGDGAETVTTTAPTGDEGTVATTTAPPRDSEFCREMLALDERLLALDDDEVADALADVVDTYARLDAIAPFEVSDDLAVVRDRIERQLAGEALTADETAAADDAAELVAAWVDMNCAGVVNNPGPPPTVPP